MTANPVSPTSRGRLLADRYRLDGLIGAGGMATVHRGWDVLLRRTVAIKVFPGVDDPITRRRIENEIRTLAALSHPGLVPVYDAGTSGATRFVVMRLVEGRTLRNEINQGPLPLHEVRRLGAAIADALAHVHAHGVIHRDLKPSNILLDEDGEPHLADFGLALTAGVSRVTLSQQVVGTAPYLAPEQVRGGEIGPAVDVYALGLVLLECLSGRTEYDGGGVEAAVARLHRPPHVPRDLPDDMVRLLSLMTAMTPKRRPSAEDCARILRNADKTPAPLLFPRAERSSVDEDTAVDMAPVDDRAVPRQWLIAGTLAAVLGVGGLTWNALVDTTPPATSAPTTTVEPVTPTSVTASLVAPVAETHPDPQPVPVQVDLDAGKAREPGKGGESGKADGAGKAAESGRGEESDKGGKTAKGEKPGKGKDG